MDDLDLKVSHGEIHALIGPNGSGKTTALNLVNGIYFANAGSIVLGGRDVTRLAPHLRAQLGLSRTFQTVRLFWSLTVLENVMIGMHACTRFDPLTLIRGRSAPSERAAEDEARQILAFVGLIASEHVIARALPYGEQRILEIARALASHPDLLLLDEPAAGLNGTETADLAELLRRIREAGVTVLLIEHDMNLVMAVSDLITVLNFGQKIAEGSPRTIRHNPRVLEAYLGHQEPELQQNEVVRA